MQANYNMKIYVKARPGANKSGVEKIDELHYIVSVKEPPIRGMANRAIIKILAEYFRVPLARINIISGHTSRQKLIEIAI